MLGGPAGVRPKLLSLLMHPHRLLEGEVGVGGGGSRKTSSLRAHVSLYEDARYLFSSVWQYEETRDVAVCGHIYSCMRTRDIQLHVDTYSSMRTHTQQYADTYTAV